MITIEATGDFPKTQSWLERLKKDAIFETLDRYGQEGVMALERATPYKTGETSRSWYYEIKRDGRSYSLIWGTTNTIDGVPVVILLQYGHATGTGGYVAGQDFINPALRPVFDRIAQEVWEAVSKT